MTPDTPRPGFSTRAIHAGQDADPATGAAITTRAPVRIRDLT
jgi:O-acetylhomoserine/O-acetylserine sulfhydrylase-like pyridoxal-dependent enzyme